MGFIPELGSIRAFEGTPVRGIGEPFLETGLTEGVLADFAFLDGHSEHAQTDPAFQVVFEGERVQDTVATEYGISAFHISKC